MSAPAPRPGRPSRVPHDRDWLSLRVLRLLTVVFTAAAAGSLVLVAVDLLVARPAARDTFVAFLNSLAALVLRRWRSEQART
jgi:hypothetical protein